MKNVGRTERGDGWEATPNPVAQIIAARTTQVGGMAAVALAGAWAALPAPAFWPAVPLGGGVMVAGGLSAYFVGVFYARTRWGVPLLTRVPSEGEKGRAALTFDDGPHPDTTPRLLDVLSDVGVSATFFLVGERARAYPALTRRIADTGHAIGVHGLRHRTMVLQSAREIARDLGDCEKLLTDITGRALGARLLRPPYGFKNPTLCYTARRLGWHIVSWSLDPRDYDPHTASSLAQAVRAKLSPGDIVLLHERPGSLVTSEALPRILEDGRARGVDWVTLA